VTELEFRLLGPLEVLAGGDQVPIPGAKERSLLALLLLHAGRVVSADRLLAELWGEHLPDDPANALQTRVAKLRRALGQAGARGLLASRRPGYVLEVAPERVDVHRFERLLADPRRMAGTAGASGRFGEALALWRGPALAGELGIDPSPELRQLEQAILVQDPALAAPEPLAGAAVATLPAERLATGTGVVTMARQVGGILGVAILVAVLGTPDAAGVGAAFDRAWAVMAAAGLASALLSLTLRSPAGLHAPARPRPGRIAWRRSSRAV
jgi:DNA-binding SARP family transcriptional activator